MRARSGCCMYYGLAGLSIAGAITHASRVASRCCRSARSSCRSRITVGVHVRHGALPRPGRTRAVRARARRSRCRSLRWRVDGWPVTTPEESDDAAVEDPARRSCSAVEAACVHASAEHGSAARCDVGSRSASGVRTDRSATCAACSVTTGGTMEEGFMLVFPERMLEGRRAERRLPAPVRPGRAACPDGLVQARSASRSSAERTFGLLQHFGIIFALFTLARPWGRDRGGCCCRDSVVFYVLTPIGLTAMAWNGGLALVPLERRLRVACPHREPSPRTLAGSRLAGAGRPGADVPARSRHSRRARVWRGCCGATERVAHGACGAVVGHAPDVGPRRDRRAPRRVRGMLSIPCSSCGAGASYLGRRVVEPPRRLLAGHRRAGATVVEAARSLGRASRCSCGSSRC